MVVVVLFIYFRYYFSCDLSYVLLFTFHGGSGGGCFYLFIILGITFPVIFVSFLSIASRGLIANVIYCRCPD